MIRVGFVLEDATWLGGVNYYRNLFSALALLPDHKVQSIIFVASDAPTSVIETLKHCEIVQTSLLNHRSLLAIIRKGITRITSGCDIALKILLASYSIDVLSHSGDICFAGKLKTIGWIPDFQHLHLPDFFCKKDWNTRDRIYRRWTSRCDRIILSSAAAQRDLSTFDEMAIAKTRLLRFVPEIDLNREIRPFFELAASYNITSPYFFLPNQFWAHKNHIAVIDALKILKEEGINAIVLATGNSQDHRSKTHFAEINKRINSSGLLAEFRILGVLPYADMLALMSNALAVIKSTFFNRRRSTSGAESSCYHRTMS